MAERLRDNGFGVVVVDYLSAEGVANTCRGEIPHVRVGEYVAGSLSFARALPLVDTARLFVIGWSHGGGGVLAWLASLAETSPRAAGAVVVYPECNSREPWFSAVPVLVLLGGADDISLPQKCERLVRALPDASNVTVRSYDEARHGFDLTEGPEVLPLGNGMSVGRNDGAGGAAWVEIFAFLRHLTSTEAAIRLSASR